MLNYQRVSRSYSLVAVSSWPFTKLRFQDLQANKAVRTWATAMSPTTGWSFATGATGATESPTSTAVLANRDRNLMAMAPRWRLGDPRLGDPFKNWIRARGVVFQFVVSTCFKQLVNAECFMSLWKTPGYASKRSKSASSSPFTYIKMAIFWNGRTEIPIRRAPGCLRIRTGT